MYKMKNRFLLILITFAVVNTSFAQSINDFVNKGLEANDISKRLPSLDSLIFKAKENSPRLKFFDADFAYWDGAVVLEKRAWLNNINIEAAYGYGIYDNLSNEQLAGGATASQALISTEQSRYTVGASIKLPLASIFNRGRKIKNAEAEADKSKYSKEFAIWELEQLIVTQYNDLIKAHRLLFISNSIVESYKVQSIRAEKDFANAIINISDYTRLQQMLNQAISSFESQRSEFLIALKSLEGTVGIEIQF